MWNINSAVRGSSRDVARLVDDLQTCMTAKRARLSTHALVAKAMVFMFVRRERFMTFLGGGRICLMNNAAERSLRGVTRGRKSWRFAGSDRGGDRAALVYTLTGTAKLNNVDPPAWLAKVLAHIAGMPITRRDKLLPLGWKPHQPAVNAG